MILDRVEQQVTEAKIYTIDYSQWLASGEEITDVTTTVDPVGTTPDLVANAVVATSKIAIELTVSGGEALISYTVSMNVTTDKGQIKTDCLVFSIYTTCAEAV